MSLRGAKRRSNLKIMKICAIIPAYNEQDQIGNVVQGVLKHVDQVYVIDDGSTDTTAKNANHAGANVISHPRNQGKGAAISTGIKAFLKTNSDAFVILDADAQHDWDELPLFIQKMEQTSASIVLGNRMRQTKNMPLIRKWTNQFTSWVVSKLSGQRVEDSQCGYRLIQRKVVEEIQLSLTRFDAESEFLIQAARAGYKIEQVSIKTIYRGDEVSKINPIIDTVRFFKMVWKYRRSNHV